MTRAVAVGADAIGRVVAVDDGDNARADCEAEMHDAGVGRDERLRAGEQRGRFGEGELADEIVVRLVALGEKMVELGEARVLILTAEDEKVRVDLIGAEPDQRRVTLDRPITPRGPPSAAEL